MRKQKYEEDEEDKKAREAERERASLERGRAAKKNARGQALDIRSVYGRLATGSPTGTSPSMSTGRATSKVTNDGANWKYGR